MSYTLDKAKILIVDDMKPMLSLTRSILNIFGFKEIYTADNADDAFELLTKSDPDMVITDWMMEPIDGLAFAQKIRRSPFSPNPYVPILMMTGFSSRLRVEESRDSGVTEFLVKPFTARDLYTRVAQISEKPRQFVDCGTFFGPDRRRRSEEGYEGPRRRDLDSMKKKEAVTDEQKQANDLLKKLRENAKNVSE